MSARHATPEAADTAAQCYRIASAAVRAGLIGPMLREMSEQKCADDISSLQITLEQLFSIYIAVTCLNATRRAMADVLGMSPKRIRRHCRFVEAWREAPLIDVALRQVEQSLPRAI